MDRLPEQVVTWHNQHPLAKRISIYDVHTIGVVALPFMRSGPPARGPVEPVLTDAVSDESLAAWGSEDSTVAANTNAAHLDALADQEDEPPPSARAGRPAWQERLLALLGRGKGGNKARDEGWPAFSERFIDGLSARRVARFALEHGYSARPGDESWPHRVIPIDEQQMSGDGVAGGAWPFEIYLVSTAIDAGSSRSRILAGRSAGAALPPILGKRCLDPKRVGLAALVPLCIVAAAGGLLWQRNAPDGAALEAAAGASSAPLPASSAAASGTVLVASVAPSAPASAVEVPASAPAAESHVAEATPSSSAAASEPVVDIRPRLVESSRVAEENESKPAPPPLMAQAGSAPPQTAVPAAAQAASEAPTLPIASVRPDLQQAAQKGTPVVALVAPPTRTKAEAEATLAKMQELVKPLQPADSVLQAQVFESPEGWRAAVWPFGSRVEAQLVNATLVARGLHTKAVDF